MSLNPEFVAQLERVDAALDSLDYFQLLRVTPAASTDEIRAAYRRQAQQFHPDRYAGLGDAALHERLGRIARRITEAYVVLRDEAKRQRYRAVLDTAGRVGNLRYNIAHEDSVHRDQQAERGLSVQAQRLVADARAAWERGSRADAVRGLRMAMLYDKDNPALTALLDAWTRAGETP